jgi:hypothetical protein
MNTILEARVLLETLLEAVLVTKLDAILETVIKEQHCWRQC